MSIASLFRKKVTIVTHDGSYHADDVMATAILGLWLEKQNIPYRIIRTRDDTTIASADYAYDLGGIYDHALRRYDHHQTGGAGTRDNGVPYAACGLIWKHYGLDLCEGDKRIWQTIDQQAMQAIDAPDNGFSTFTLIDERYPSPYTLGNALSSLKPSSQESFPIQRAFDRAVSIAREMLERELVHAKARASLIDHMQKLYETSHDKRMIILEDEYSRSEIQISLNELNAPKLLYVVFNTGDSWRILAVPKERRSFELRKPLPAVWSGLVDEALVQVSGVLDAQFCHKNLFLAGAKTKEGTLALAEKALAA